MRYQDRVRREATVFRRQWKLPAPTPIAKQLWRAIWTEEPWPKGWRVEWLASHPRSLGTCSFDAKTIFLVYPHAVTGIYGEVIYTLIHEFVHMKTGLYLHNTRFRLVEQLALAKIGLTLEFDY